MANVGNVGNVGIQQQDYQTKKCNTGKFLGVLAGLGLTAYDGFQVADSFSHEHLVRKAADYIEGAFKAPKYATIRPQTATPEFLEKTVKSLKRIKIAEVGLNAVMLVAGALAVGTVVDGVINAVKGHKAAKAAKAVQAQQAE